MTTQHHHHQHADRPAPKPTGMRKHAKWISILALVAMLGALVIYILTDDESLQPGEPAQTPTPAAAP